jgi:chromosomal replication initiation ATPase DnaA
MLEKQLIKQIKKIVYELDADRSLINELLTTYRISKSDIKHIDEEIVLICSCEVWDLDPNKLRGKSRQGNRPLAKHFISHYISKNTNNTYQSICNFMRYSHHSSVIHAKRKIDNLLDVDKDIQIKYDKFSKLIQERL